MLEFKKPQRKPRFDMHFFVEIEEAEEFDEMRAKHNATRREWLVHLMEVYKHAQ